MSDVRAGDLRIETGEYASMFVVVSLSKNTRLPDAMVFYLSSGNEYWHVMTQIIENESELISRGEEDE